VVGGLTKKWEMTTEANVTANSAIDSDFQYFAVQELIAIGNQ